MRDVLCFILLVASADDVKCSCTVNQTTILRYNYDDPVFGTCSESLQGGNHFRVFKQNGTTVRSRSIRTRAQLPKRELTSRKPSWFVGELGSVVLSGEQGAQPLQGPHDHSERVRFLVRFSASRQMSTESTREPQVRSRTR